MEYASKGVANAGLATGIIGSALGLLNGGLGNNLMGYGNRMVANGNYMGECCSENTMVSRYELEQERKISQLQSEKDMLLSDQRTDGKILELYQYMEQQFTKDRENVSARFTETGRTIADLAANQAVINQRVTDNLSFVDSKIDNSVAALYKEIECKTLPLEKKIPLTSICPQPMQRYNSWVAPTETAPTTPTTTG
ncbi:MAG: hypothetical protein K2H01_01625 [Ruminococcus sp.]|nr:hypothetical protein [Ruminococcus sp.]